jgi:hypothetical protein
MKFIPKNIISQDVTRSIGRKVLTAKKNSPHIFFVGGVIGTVGSTVLACRATLKLEGKIDEIKRDLDAVKELSKTRQEKEHYQDLGYVCVKSTIVIGRLYAPAVVVGAVSIAALTGSHIQLTRRNAALSATLAAVSKAYDNYRIRVQEEVGKERELDIYRDMKEQEVEVDGKKNVVKVTDPNGWSPYARFFDETADNWQRNAEMNRHFLHLQQNYANDLLRSRGHIFLNEVYDLLGLERSQAGQIVGWVMNGEGDNYVDFGLFECESSRFINHLEQSIILDFNVDGVVYDKI